MNTKSKKSKDLESSSVIDRLTMAEMLETIRDDLGLTKVEMAKKIGITKQNYNNIVNENATVSVSRAIKFAQLLEDSEKVFVVVAIEDELARAERTEYKVDISLRENKTA